MRTGVLFDFYDTLAFLTPSIIEEGRRELARLAGVTPEEFAPLWRANSRERMLGTAGDLAAQLRAMLGTLGHQLELQILDSLVAHEYGAWERAVQLYPDTRPILAELRRRGFKLGILSNCSCQAGAVIHRLGLGALVDSVTLSFEVGYAKPDEPIYRAACAAIGLDPTACVFVADGAGGELEAARALGMHTIKIHHPDRRQPEDFTVQADHRVESLTELLSITAALTA
jgi:putative hydrolase of the HAD superfamily